MVHHLMDYRGLVSRIISQTSPEVFVNNLLNRGPVTITDSCITVKDRKYELNNNVTLFGFGKASIGMYDAVYR